MAADEQSRTIVPGLHEVSGLKRSRKMWRQDMNDGSAASHLARAASCSLRPGLIPCCLDPHADPLHILRRTHAMVARIAPSILELLGNGIPRSRRAFVAALADRYSKEEVELTLMRLAVTGQILAASGKYTLLPATEPEQG